MPSPSLGPLKKVCLPSEPLSPVSLLQLFPAVFLPLFGHPLGVNMGGLLEQAEWGWRQFGVRQETVVWRVIEEEQEAVLQELEEARVAWGGG